MDGDSSHTPTPTLPHPRWGQSAHTIFESVVDEHPERVALVCGTQRLSYQEVDRRANQIARAILHAGIEPGSLVGLALPRGVELLISAMGILKAGCAYVPLDPTHPQSRSRQVVREAGLAAALTRKGVMDAALDRCRTIDLESCDRFEADRPLIRREPADLAYVLFTSGSTGIPKGVPIQHEGIARLVFGQRFAPFGPDLTWLKLAPMGFDASTLEIYGAWLHGARLVVWDRDEIDANALSELTNREQVRACFMSFGLLSTMLDLKPDVFAPFRTVSTGGEAVLPKTMRRATELCPGVQFVAAYGPTEATAFTTTWDIDVVDESLETVPIGTPLEGLVCRLLRADGSECSRGEVGEICIGGLGVTPGYLNRPDLNSERFCADPLGEVGCLYRSGDLAMELPSGVLLFQGRIDSQVKVRGNRVELREIDLELERSHGVRRAGAAVVGNGPNQAVVACVVAEDQGFDPDALIDRCAGSLPRYMVPISVRRVDDIPFTPNGKIDRSAIGNLAAPEPGRRTRGGDPPSSATEEDVASVWREVLEIDLVSRDDAFLDLGGHSLKAIVACARIRDRIGVAIGVGDLYRLGPLHAVCAWCDEQPKVETRERGRADRSKPGSLTQSQKQLWIINRLDPEDVSYTITSVLGSDSALDREAFEHAWLGLLDRHESLRTRFREIGGQPVQIVVEDPDPKVEWMNPVPSDEVAQVAAGIGRVPFDLEAGPPVRVAVVPVQEGGVRIVVSIHHIASDGWSCEVLRRDLGELYQAWREGREPELPELGVQIFDLAADTSADTDPLLEWWGAYLDSAPVAQLPGDWPGASSSDSDGIRERAAIVGADAARIRAAAKRLGVTPFGLLFGAFHAWVSRVTWQGDLVVGTPIAGRDRPGLEHAIGFFMESLPVRTRVQTTDYAAEVIRGVWDSFRDAERHRGVAFDEVVTRVRGGHEAGRAGLFELFFNHIAMPMHGGEGAFRFEQAEVDNGTAKFDLTCYAHESDDRFELVFNGRSSRFGQATLARWVKQFARFINEIARDSDRPLEAIPLLEADEQARFSENCSAPAIPISGPMLAHERVWLRLEGGDSSAAVRVGSRVMSAADLWMQSGRIATVLQSKGIGSGDFVAIVSGDGEVVPAAVLGVLRSGAAFVPVEPSWPDARIKRVFEQSKPAAVLVDESQAKRTEALASGIEVLGPPWGRSDDVRKIEISFTDPAYMLFTSGSTGTPKGVVQSHAGLVRQIETYVHQIGVRHDDVLLMVSSPAYDAAIMDLFGAWFAGASVAPFELAAGDADALAQHCRSSAVTIYHSTPTVLRWLNSSGLDAGAFDCVRAVVLGGEAAIGSDIESAQQLFPNAVSFVNGLGMSESSLVAQYHTGREEAHDALTPIGSAVPGVSLRILGQDGAPTDGFGELEIQSDRLAEGVLLADGTMDRVGSEQDDGTRRFATGDLVSVRSDGLLEHRGRRDEQIQISGVRVEPGEVRAAVYRLRGVRDAAVVVMNEERPTLRAVVVATAGASVAALRAELSRELPTASIPSEILLVDQVPRIGGGKIDAEAIRRMMPPALPEADIGAHALTPIESRVIEVFREVLEAPQAEIDDDFFALGGDSLRAIRAFGLLRARLGTTLPMGSIFRAPTPAGLAALIAEDPGVDPEPPLVAMREAGSNRPLYLLPGVGGHALAYAPLVRALGAEQPCWGLQFPGVAGQREPMATVEELAAYFIDEFDLRDGTAPDLLGYSFGGAVAFEIALRLQQQGVKPGRLILLDSHLMNGLPQKPGLGRFAQHLRRMSGEGVLSRARYITGRVTGKKSTQRGRGAALQAQPVLAEVRRVIEANRRAIVAYQPGGIYRGPVLLIRAIQPDWLAFHRDDGHNGWKSFLGGEIRRERIDAIHKRVVHAEHAMRLAELIQRTPG